ncbi:MAG: sodium:solute symporter family protein [Pseudomonadota bacterium]
MSEQEIILAGVGGYLLLMLGIGFFAARRTHNPEDFMVAGRSLPLWLCGATVLATWIGGGTVMGASGEAYEGGVIAVIADPFGAAVGLLLFGLLVVRLMRRLKLLTVVDFIHGRYGPVAAFGSAIAAVITSTGWSSALMVAFGFVFNSLTGVPLPAGIVLGGVIVLIYTTVGGMWAVALTDFVQIAVILVGLFILLFTVVGDLGGWQAAWAMIPAGAVDFLPREDSASAWLNYVRAWTIIGVSNLASQSLLQRGFSARTETVAQNSFYIAGVGYLLVGSIPVFLGILASVAMPGLADKEAVMPLLAMEYLHPVLMAIFVGALLAAIMSSADSALLSASSVISNNILPMLHPPLRERRLFLARLMIPVVGLIALFIALQAQAIYAVIVNINAVVLAAIIVPFMAGIWWRKANRTGGLAAMATGVVVWLGTEFVAPELPGDLIGGVASLVAILVVSSLTQERDPPAPLRSIDGETVEFRDRLGVSRGD